QDLAPDQGCGGSQQLRSEHAEGPECRSTGEAEGVLRHASSLRADDCASWKYIAPIQRAAARRGSFEYGTWVENSGPNSCRRRARSSRKNIGAPAVSLTPTWICSSRITASIS